METPTLKELNDLLDRVRTALNMVDEYVDCAQMKFARDEIEEAAVTLTKAWKCISKICDPSESSNDDIEVID